MFRLSGLLSLCLAVVCGSLLFWTSQSVQRAENKLTKAQQKNQAEKETLRVLSAEWDYLNRPERLEQLTRGNLDMDQTHVDAQNFVSASEDIPQPVVPVLPKMKPVYVGHDSKSSKKQQAPIIEKSERDSFDRLIDSVSEDGGAR